MINFNLILGWLDTNELSMSIDQVKRYEQLYKDRDGQSDKPAFCIPNSGFRKVFKASENKYGHDTFPSLKLPSDFKIITSEISWNSEKFENYFGQMCYNLSSTFRGLKEQTANPEFFSHPYNTQGNIQK